MNKFLQRVATFLFLFGLNGYAHAITVDFNFTGECDDCAFDMSTLGTAAFDPLNDGLTETVSGKLSIDGFENVGGEIQFWGAGTATFTYSGSSLINPFTIGAPNNFYGGLLTTGAVTAGSEFTYSSSQNLTDPANPLLSQFPNFCTALGEQVLGFIGCNSIGEVFFKLNSAGEWSVSGMEVFDIGGNGQLVVANAVPVPGAIILFASGLVGLTGFSLRRKVLQNSEAVA